MIKLKIVVIAFIIIILSYQLLPTPKPTHSIATKEHKKETNVKACFVILVRNEELDGIISTIKQVEKTFNSKFEYPYVFLNDVNFTDTFKTSVSRLTNADISFGKIEQDMWGYPDYINQTYAAECRQRMRNEGVPYGDSESYRHMCRFQSGFFFRHPLLDEFEYYWRLEPDVDYYCQLDYDVFQYMKDNKKKYGFNIAYVEHIETIPTLWNTVMQFLADNPDISSQLPKRSDTLFDFISNDNGTTYNTCHFWSNFEIGDLSLWRSEAYLRLFDYLDRAGGFFYERWGDAPVHSIAASILLNKSEFHFFKDIGYRHTSYTHCPVGDEFRLKCTCDPNKNFGKYQLHVIREDALIKKCIDFTEQLSCYPIYKSVFDPSYKDMYDFSSIHAKDLYVPF